MNRVVAATGLFLLISGGVVIAQENLALLQQGPEKKLGIIYLTANVLEYSFGVYAHGADSIEVLYLEEEVLPLPDDSLDFFCSGLELIQLTDDKTVLFFKESGWWLIFIFERGYENPCGFIIRFIQRLKYFKNATPESPAVPFPAVIDVQ